jgi:hypothetical protein
MVILNNNEVFLNELLKFKSIYLSYGFRFLYQPKCMY